MPQETNLNVAPYFDDFEPSSNYYKVLYKPGFPMCSCNDGYEGDLFFDENSLSWMGVCIENTVNADDPVDDESNNSTDANNSIPLDEDNEVPGFGLMTVTISLLAISFFRRRK